MLKKIAIIIFLIIFIGVSFGETITVYKGNHRYEVEGTINDGNLFIGFNDMKNIMNGDIINNYTQIVDAEKLTVKFVKIPKYDKELKLKVGETYGYEGLVEKGISVQGPKIYEYVDKDILKFTAPGSVKIVRDDEILVEITVVSEIEGKVIKGPVSGKFVLEKGDYIIDEDFLIKRSGRLFIEDGVRISVKNGARIKVLGTIIKDGDGRAEFYYDPLVKSGNIMIENIDVELENIDFKGFNRITVPFIHAKERELTIKNCTFSGSNLKSQVILFEKYGNKLYDTTFDGILSDGEDIVRFKNYEGDSFIRNCTFKNITNKNQYGSDYLIHGNTNSKVSECNFDGIKNFSGVSGFSKVEKSKFTNFRTVKDISIISSTNTVYNNVIDDILYSGSVGRRCVGINGSTNIDKNKISNMRADYIDDRTMIIAISNGNEKGRIMRNEIENSVIGIQTNTNQTRHNIVNDCKYAFMTFTGDGTVTISDNEYNTGDIIDIEKNIDLKRLKISR